jgi:hypothetical protein
MFHPLAEDFSKLKDSEIESRIQDLSRKYFMTQNSNIKHQLALFIDVYKAELSTRRTKALEQSYQKRDKDLDKLINVK